MSFSDVTCVGYTAYNIKQKVIVIAFRGGHRGAQGNDILGSVGRYGLQTYFPNNGKIFKVVYDFFMFLWNGGMNQDLRQLKYKYPNYELWVNGHSLGGALTWTASSYIATIGLYKPEQMKVVAMGVPRIGDYNFAEWHSKTVRFGKSLLSPEPFSSLTPITLFTG